MSSVKICSPSIKRHFKQLALFHTTSNNHFNALGCKIDIRRYLSIKANTCNIEYNCKEVGIPVPGGTLAGKLWEPKSSNGKQSDLEEMPPVICLHGWLDNSGTFDLMLPLMTSPATKYFCLDFPGHGLTTYCPDWWYDSHVEGLIAIKRVMKYFGWDKFSILDHSLGGIVGFLYTAYFPDDVHNLVAMENMRPLPLLTNRIDMMRASINLLFSVEERMRKPENTYSYDDILKKMYEGRQGTISKEGCVALLKRGTCKLNTNHHQFSYNLRVNIPGQEGRTPPELSLQLAEEISSPVCFIKGDPGNVYDTEEETTNFLSVFKNKLGDKFEHHMVPGTHHFHLNDPQLVAPIILEFLRKNNT